MTKRTIKQSKARAFKEVAREKMRNMGMTYRQLSNRTGIPYDSLYNYMDGGCLPPQERAEAIAFILGFELSTVFFEPIKDVHIFTLSDQRKHDDKPTCWCEPEVESTARFRIFTHRKPA